MRIAATGSRKSTRAPTQMRAPSTAIAGHASPLVRRDDASPRWTLVVTPDGFGDLRARANPELAEHAAHVRLDGLLGQEQLARDLLVGAPERDQVGHLALAAGQRRQAVRA